MGKRRNRKNVDKEIIIALIGVVSTVITGVFMILQAEIEVEAPINATKTAESVRLTLTPLHSTTPTMNATKTAESVSLTLTPLHSATPTMDTTKIIELIESSLSVSPSPSVKSTVIGSQRADLLTTLMDSMQRGYQTPSSPIIAKDPFWGCDVPVLLRKDISTDNAKSCLDLPFYNNNNFDLFVSDVILPIAYIQKESPLNNDYEIEFFPQKTNGAIIPVILSSDEILYLEPLLNVQIEKFSFQAETERGVRFCIGGGGGMNFFHLAPIELRNQFEVYQVKRSFGIENPFYVLDAAGIMVITPFICRDLGVYRITFFAEYRSRNTLEKERVDEIFAFSLICPQQFKVWTLPEDGGVIKYTWDKERHLYLRVDTLP